MSHCAVCGPIGPSAGLNPGPGWVSSRIQAVVAQYVAVFLFFFQFFVLFFALFIFFCFLLYFFNSFCF